MSGNPAPPYPGTETGHRTLIVNADDLGMDRLVTDGILRAHREGVVTSASLMVHRPDAERAAAEATRLPGLSVGLHVELAEWTQRDGTWVCTRSIVDVSDADAVRSELERQLVRFQGLMGRLPTHLDSHQHVHRNDPEVRPHVKRMGERLGVTVRSLDPLVQYCGDFYGQDGHGVRHPEWISVEGLVRLIEALPLGITEVGCHPGLPGLQDPYGCERALELETLIHARVRACLAQHGLRLRSHSTLDEVEDVLPSLA